MKTIEIQLRSHRYLIYIAILIVPLAVWMMVNTFFNTLTPIYRGYITTTVMQVEEPLIEMINVTENDSLVKGLTKQINNIVLLKITPIASYKMYRDVVILLSLLWVIISYVFVYDPLLRGHYTMLMNLAGYSRGYFIIIHMVSAVIYSAIVTIIILLGFTIYHLRAGSPFTWFVPHLFIVFILGYISYHLLGLFLGMVTKSVEISILSILPLTLIKALPPDNPFSYLSPDILYIYTFVDEYANIISVEDVTLSLLIYVLIGIIGVYLFLKGRVV